MAGNIERIVFEIIGRSKSGEAALSSIQKKLAKFGAALTATSASGLAAMFKLGEGGAAVEGIERKFARMTKAFGHNAGEMLSGWQEASRGVVDEAELMSKANALALAGINPMREMGWMLNSVATAAEATGKGFAELYEQLALGLARGSAARLDDLGLIVSEAEAKERYAKSIGVEVNQLSRDHEQLAILAATREAAAKQGEFFGEVTETNATKIARARASIRNLGNDIKKLFAPAAGKMADALSNLISLWDRIPEPIKRTVASVAAAAAGLGAVVGPVVMVIGLLPKLKGMISSVGAGLKLLGVTGAASLGPVVPIILGVVAAIGLLVAAGRLLSRGWKENWGGIRDAVQNVIAQIKPILERIAADVRYWIAQIKQSFAGVMEAVRGLIEPALIRLRQLFGSGAGLQEFLLYFKDATNVVLGTVQAMINSIRLLLEGKSDQAMTPLKDAALNIVTLIVLGWKKFVVKAARWGWNLIVSFAQGVVNAGKTVLKQAATFIGNMVSRFLASFSPPKEGPLTGIIGWGKNLIDNYLKGFALADFAVLRDVLSPIRDALESAVSLGDMDRPEMLETFRSVRTEVAGLISSFRETGVINEEVLAGISQRLGEGSEEYTRYIRLTLEHQKAMQNLKAVQEEVADAEARGFIPQALSDKLAAAEQEAQAAEDAASWQQEYLASLQEGADIQREMVEALQQLGEKMKGVADALAGLKKGGAGEGEGAGLGLDFSGLSDAFEEEKGKVRAWLAQTRSNISTWFDNTKKLVAQKFGEWWEDLKEVPVLGTLLEFLETKIPEGITALETVWDETFIPILERGRRFLDEDLNPLLDALRELLEVTVLKATEVLSGIWTGTLLPALEDVWSYVEENVLPIFGEIVTFVEENFIKAIEKLDEWLGTTLLESWGNLMDKLSETKTSVLDPILSVFDLISGSVQGLITWIGKAIEWLKKFKVPDPLVRNSPSPLEQAFMAVNDQVSRLSGALPMLQRALNFQVRGLSSLALAMAPAAVNGRLVGGPVIVIQIGEQTFPNVRDGRDANGFLREFLDETTGDADLRGLVPGGLS